MAGTSFKCPMCNVWSISKVKLVDHLFAQHGLGGAIIHGSGSNTMVSVLSLFHRVVNACRKLPWYRGSMSASQFRLAFNEHMGCDIPNGPVDQTMGDMLKVLEHRGLV